MASPAAASPQANGLAPSPRPLSPASINSTTKRKRDDDDSASPVDDASDTNNPAVNGSRAKSDQKAQIRDFFHVLRRHDTDTSILKFPIPGASQDDEPDAKRQKSEESTPPSTIEDKIQQAGYDTLEDVISDITQVVKAKISARSSSDSAAEISLTDEMKEKVLRFKDKAHELYKREFAYPQVDLGKAIKTEAKEDQGTGGPVSLMIYSSTSIGKKPLLTSLQRYSDGPENRNEKSTLIADADLPNGIYIARTPSNLPIDDKPSRSLTLGELFPSPRNLPPLQPQKPSKSTIKNNVLTFYHPELTNQSKYRSGTYFSQQLTMGHWLDYSNATPATHIKTKQRERAQSLAGHKPSSDELEMSEMEALFRGAFSSFAPCKDDTAAVVPSGYLSHMYWQQMGRRSFKRMIESESSAEEQENADAVVDSSALMEVDEKAIQDAIDTWDDSVVDPTLAEVMGEKSDADKETDDLLEEVSDLIETLSSYQRNRNLTLPTSQDRHSTDPPNGDMLRNGSLSHQPSEEEMLTYEALKSQLSLIIRALPPFAVARINSDKLEELNISTKIQVRTNEYRGVMDEDESAARARLAASQQAATSSQRVPHRTPSMSGGVQYATQYAGQYGSTSRSPMPTTPQFPHTPVRASPQTYHRPGSGMPVQTHHPAQVRPPPQPQYRGTPNGYAPQLAKTQTPYGHSNMGQYAGGPPRTQGQSGGYGVTQVTPNPRYPPNHSGGYSQQQQQHQYPQQQMHHQQRQFAPHVNGGSPMPQRTTSSQVSGQPQHYGQSQSPSQQHQQVARPPYNQPHGQMPPNARHYGAGTSPVNLPASIPQHPQQQSQQTGNRSHIGITGYHTVMGDAQQQQVMDQARQQALARHDAQSRTIGYNNSPGSGGSVKTPQQGEIVGLAGIGLGRSVDVHKLAAARANMASMSHGSMSPSPKPVAGSNGVASDPRSPMQTGPAGVNGVSGGAAPQPQVAPAPMGSPASAHASVVSGPTSAPAPTTPAGSA